MLLRARNDNLRCRQTPKVDERSYSQDSGTQFSPRRRRGCPLSWLFSTFFHRWHLLRLNVQSEIQRSSATYLPTGLVASFFYSRSNAIALVAFCTFIAKFCIPRAQSHHFRESNENEPKYTGALGKCEAQVGTYICCMYFCGCEE